MLLVAHPWLSRDFNPIVIALGVASLSDRRNSLKRNVRSPIATTNGNVHFIKARSSSFLRCLQNGGFTKSELTDNTAEGGQGACVGRIGATLAVVLSFRPADHSGRG